jgi:hypothetical protein
MQKNREDIRSFTEINYDISSHEDIIPQLKRLKKVKIIIDSIYRSVHPHMIPHVNDDNFKTQQKRMKNLVTYIKKKKINAVIIFNKLEVTLIKAGGIYDSIGHINYLDHLFNDHFNNETIDSDTY